MYLDAIFATLIFVGVPSLLCWLVLRRVARRPGRGRFGEWACFALGLAGVTVLMAVWLTPALLSGRDPHQLEVAGLALCAATVVGLVTWWARHHRAGGLYAAFGGTLGAALPFDIHGAMTDSTRLYGVGLMIVGVSAITGLGLVAVITAAVRGDAVQQV